MSAQLDQMFRLLPMDVHVVRGGEGGLGRKIKVKEVVLLRTGKGKESRNIHRVNATEWLCVSFSRRGPTVAFVRLIAVDSFEVWSYLL